MSTTPYESTLVGAALLGAAVALDRASELMREAAASADLSHGNITGRAAFLSVVGAAEVLGLSRATVNRRISDGTLRSRRVGGRRLIPVAAVEELTRAADA